MAEESAIVYFAGQGKTIPVLVSKAQFDKIKQMSGTQRQKFIKDFVKKEFKRTKGFFGICKMKKEKVTVLACIDCGKDERGLKTRSAWELCALQYINPISD